MEQVRESAYFGLANVSAVWIEDRNTGDEFVLGSFSWWTKQGAAAVLLCLGMFVGIPINILLIKTILTNYRLRATQDLLIANTCMIALVQCVFVLPWMVSFRVTRQWLFSQGWCQFSLFAEEFLAAAYCFGLLSLALNHARRTFFPHMLCLKREVLKILLLIFPWISAGASMPRWFIKTTVISRGSLCEILFNYENFCVWSSYVTVRNFAFPLITTLVLLLTVALWDWKRNHRRRREASLHQLAVYDAVKGHEILSAEPSTLQASLLVRGRLAKVSFEVEDFTETQIGWCPEIVRPTGRSLSSKRRSMAIPRHSLVDLLAEGKQPIATVLGMVVTAFLLFGSYYVILLVEKTLLCMNFYYANKELQFASELSLWLLDSVVFMEPVIIILCSRRYRRVFRLAFRAK